MGTAAGKYKLRLLQGGVTIRKLRRWFAAVYRYRYPISSMAVLVIFPYHPHLQHYFLTLFSNIGFLFLNIQRPIAYSPPSVDIFSSPIENRRSMIPPHPTAEIYREEVDEIAKVGEMAMETRDFWNMYETEVTRSMGFIHHPSRETESLVEGALLQEDQNKLADALRYRIADFCVKRGLWKSVREAFEEREKLRKKHNPRPQNLI